MPRRQITAHIRSKLKNILRNLVTELIINGHIKITVSRKQRVQKMFDRLITFAKKNDLHNDRKIFKIIRKKEDKKTKQNSFTKLKELAIKYKDRQGGYLRCYKLKNRMGDNAPIFYLELI